MLVWCQRRGRRLAVKGTGGLERCIVLLERRT